MDKFFSIGELARQQNISRQTLIYYDKIGLFCPAYVDPDNGYRYYSSGQLDSLDTICIMKRIGFSLEEIKTHMQSYTIEDSIAALRRQLSAIEVQLQELQMIRSRVEHRCRQLEETVAIQGSYDAVWTERVEAQYILVQKVAEPASLETVSLATKECFVRSFKEKLPIFFQSGAIVPYERILQKRYTEASFAFLPIEKCRKAAGMKRLPAGDCVCAYHVGDYLSIGRSYERILQYCREKHLQICSDSYEFAINDYLSTGDETEYVTKIMFYIAHGTETAYD